MSGVEKGFPDYPVQLKKDKLCLFTVLYWRGAGAILTPMKSPG
jgi:hypothetical protein